MKQPHTEGAIDHTDGQQNTGNHPAPGTPPKAPGGTRTGAENLDESLSVNGPTEK